MNGGGRSVVGKCVIYFKEESKLTIRKSNENALSHWLLITFS